MKLAELITKYPKLFKPDFRFQCDDGWAYLLDALLGQIQHILGRYQEVVAIKQKLLNDGKDLKDYQWIEDYFKSHPDDPMATFEIHQIKEKFGGLRFYWNCVGNSADINNIHGAVAIIESLATSFCEVCGSNVEVKTRASKDKYWIRTLCQTHRQQDELAKGTT